MRNKTNIYVIDTSSLIDARKWYKRIENFWKFLEELILHKRLLISEAVKLEIDKGNDFLKVWINNYKKYVVPINESQQKIIKKINDDFPNYIDVNNFEADPYVVSLAIEKQKNRIDPDNTEIIVICEESKNEKSKINSGELKPKIPNLCEKYELKYIKIYQLLEYENKTI
ncbi:MAG: DUF4411 family protein [Nitrososphaeria archaeon]